MWDYRDMYTLASGFVLYRITGATIDGECLGALYGVQSNKYKFVTLCSRYVIIEPKKIELPLAPM